MGTYHSNRYLNLNLNLSPCFHSCRILSPQSVYIQPQPAKQIKLPDACFVVSTLPYTLMFPNLRKFKSSFKRPALFVDAVPPLPVFLQNNLQDEAREVKVFIRDPSAPVRIFYFQFLKLCFESDEAENENKLNQLTELVERHSNLLGVHGKHWEEGLDQQSLKGILLQFLQVVSEAQEPVYHMVSKYPIVDDILTTFLSNYLEIQLGEGPISAKNVFQQLSQFFQIDMVQFDDCFQFVDSQVYAYIENEEEAIYLVFINEEKALRNTHLHNTSEAIQTYSGQKQQMLEEPFSSPCQVITFNDPDILFDKTTEQFKKSSGLLDTQDTRQVFMMSNTKKSNRNSERVMIDLTNKQEAKHYLKSDKKESSNVTKQFTSSFILQIVSEPHKSSIERIKTKARANRKARKMFI